MKPPVIFEGKDFRPLIEYAHRVVAAQRYDHKDSAVCPVCGSRNWVRAVDGWVECLDCEYEQEVEE